MNYPKYVEINGRKYEINTDFRFAIECNRIANDETIGDFERVLGIIYTLFGEEGLEHQEDYEKLLEMAKKYLCCGKELKDKKEEPDMDYIEDYDYIVASFQSDYSINLDEVKMHWWKFFKLMNGLSNSELGNCCVLNRVRNLRNFDPKKIEDDKERNKIIEAQKDVALKRNKKNKKYANEKQEKSALKLYEALGLEVRKE